jgi:hypothetical protein
MLRAAIAFQRVLLIDWQSPMPIEEFFEPSRIDWRLREDELAALNQHPVQRWAQDLESEPPRTRFLRITGNAQWFAAIRASPAQKPSESSRQSTSQGMVYEPKLSCLWHFIFKPSEWLSRTLAERRTRMFGSASAPYDALHVRMGDAAEGVAFEERSVPRTDRRFSHATALHMIRCVQAQSTLPLFVATDTLASLGFFYRHPKKEVRSRDCERKDDGETDLVGLLRARASGAAALAGYRHQWGGRGRGRVRGRVQ